eukprot:5591200-Pleurochrysis_carterae.AAC.2
MPRAPTRPRSSQLEIAVPRAEHAEHRRVEGRLSETAQAAPGRAVKARWPREAHKRGGARQRSRADARSRRRGALRLVGACCTAHGSACVPARTPQPLLNHKITRHNAIQPPSRGWPPAPLPQLACVASRLARSQTGQHKSRQAERKSITFS